MAVSKREQNFTETATWKREYFVHYFLYFYLKFRAKHRLACVQTSPIPFVARSTSGPWFIAFNSSIVTRVERTVLKRRRRDSRGLLKVSVFAKFLKIFLIYWTKYWKYYADHWRIYLSSFKTMSYFDEQFPGVSIYMSMSARKSKTMSTFERTVYTKSSR